MTSMADTNLVYRDGEHPLHGTWLSVDVVALTLDAPDPARVVLIERAGEPHRGATTLPGGLLAAWDGETVEQCVHRIVAEKVGARVVGGVAIVGVVSDPGRDERGHTVSIVTAVRVPAGTVGAVPVDQVPPDMPFGHSTMLRDALTTLSQRMFADAATTYALLGDETTVIEARSLVAAFGPAPRNTVASRLKRSALYREADAAHGDQPRGRGRPAQVFVSSNS